VLGHGNSNTYQSYSFTDKPKAGGYYYRLKQIDRDGDFVYSKVVYVVLQPTVRAVD
jgi:hypothetical protein